MGARLNPIRCWGESHRLLSGSLWTSIVCGPTFVYILSVEKNRSVAAVTELELIVWRNRGRKVSLYCINCRLVSSANVCAKRRGAKLVEVWRAADSHVYDGFRSE